jgi:hypothetical protein
MTGNVRRNIAVTLTASGTNPLKMRLHMNLPVRLGILAVGALIAQGGTPGYAYSIISGATGFATAGFTLNVDGTITGTPTATGPVEFVAQVQDADTTVFTGTFEINVEANLTVAAGTPTFAESGVDYSYTFVVTGASGSLSYAVTSGSIPGSFTLNSSTGVLSGNDTEISPPTTYSFTVTATDGGSGETIDMPAVLYVLAPVTNDASSLVFYSGSDLTQFAYTSGGQGPFVLSELSNLPTWASVVFDNGTGIIAVSGNPPASTSQSVVTEIVTGTLSDSLGGSFGLTFGVTALTQQLGLQPKNAAAATLATSTRHVAQAVEQRFHRERHRHQFRRRDGGGLQGCHRRDRPHRSRQAQPARLAATGATGVHRSHRRHGNERNWRHGRDRRAQERASRAPPGRPAPQGPTGATGATGGSDIQFYGDGEDGSFVVDGTTTYTYATLTSGIYYLSRDVYLSAMSSGGATLRPRSARTAGVSTSAARWTRPARRPGSSATTAAGRAASTAATPAAQQRALPASPFSGTGSLGNGGAAGAGGNGSASTGSLGNTGTAGTAPCNGGKTGISGNGGAGSVGANRTGTAGVNASRFRFNLPNYYVLKMAGSTWSQITGGCGGSGGSGASGNAASNSGGGGGGGGAGGGVIWVACKTLNKAACVGFINADGGTGGNGANGVATGGGGGGGGAGGGGGSCRVVIGTLTGSGTLTITANGGTGGNGGTKNGAAPTPLTAAVEQAVTPARCSCGRCRRVLNRPSSAVLAPLHQPPAAALAELRP